MNITRNYVILKKKEKKRVEYQQKKIKALLTSYKYDERAYAIA